MKQDRNDSPLAILHMQVSENIQRESTGLLAESIPRAG